MRAVSPLPRSLRSAHVDPAWIDIYGHMNMAYYVKLFDDLGYEILAEYGLGEDYTQRFGLGLFTVTATINYVREVTANAPLTVTLTIDKADRKRLWTRLEMRHAELGYIAATMEQLAVNVSLETRRAAAFPAELDDVLRPYRL